MYPPLSSAEARLVGGFLKATLSVLARHDWRDNKVTSRLLSVAIERLTARDHAADLAVGSLRLVDVFQENFERVMAISQDPGFNLATFVEEDFDNWWNERLRPEEAVRSAPQNPRIAGLVGSTFSAAAKQPQYFYASNGWRWSIVLMVCVAMISGIYAMMAIVATGDTPVVNVSTSFDGNFVQGGRPYVIDGWAFRGCFNDNPDRDLGFVSPPMNLTIQACSAICRARGSRQMGLQNGNQCACGSEFGRHGRATTCNKPCSGDGRSICGDVWVQAIFTKFGDE
jgi:hypothetical protein